MAETPKRLPTYYILQICLVSILYLQHVVAGDFCTATPNATPGPNDPPLPTLPLSFQTRIEANIIDRKYTMAAVEYVDDDNNRAALKMWKSGVETDVYFDYDNNQLFSVVDSLCIVTNLSSDPNTVIFGGGDTPPGGIPHVYTTAGVLHFAKEFGEVYIGKATIRGQQANQWRSCLFWPNVNANFTVDYYFSDPSWNTSSIMTAVPLRADVTGVYVLADIEPVSFHHIYDFIDFKPTVPDDPSVFETPRGVSCGDRKKVRDMPKLKNSYYYREEIISQDSQSVTQADVWYNFDWKLVRYDQRAQIAQAPYWNLNPITEIHDYNTGVSYAMDNVIKNCTIMPIENATWDSTFNGSTNYLYLRNPQSLFFLDSSYAYSGQRKARGIDCDVFTSTRLDFDNTPTVFEMYFLSESWYASDNKGLNQNDVDIPIRLTVTTVGDEAYPTVYELYDFDQEIPDIQTAYDVSRCYSDMDKIDFRITFPTTAGELLNEFRAIFIDKSIQLISSLAGSLSLVRITKAEVHWNDNNVYLIATLLDKAPPIAKFRKQAGKIYQYKNAMQLQGVVDPSSCAEQCDSTDQFTCNSFDMCAGKQICSLSQDFASDGSKLGDSLECDHYTRVLNTRVDQEIALNDAWIILTDQVVKGTFQFTVVLDDNTKQVFKAADITSDILRNPNRQASKTALQHFTGNANKEVKGFDDLILTGMSVDDCANECLGEVIFTCQSFEYCYDTGYCVMSQQHPDERPDLIQASDHCDLYTRQYTAKFTETPGVTVLSASNTIYQNIFTDNQCAKLCVDYSEFDCKSFDYCPNINACFLGKKHVFDVPKSQINEDVRCNHYSRNYADDFKVKANKVISLRDNRVIEGISAEQCAKLCVEEESFSCASFDYCGNMTECRLSDATMSDVGQVTVETSAYCAVYQRMYYPDGSVYTKPTSSGYSAGAMGGLGFAMLIVGAVLAIVIYFGIGKWRGKSFDSMTISFKNMENSD